MGFIIHVSSVSCGSFDAEKLQEKELWREHPRSVDDLTWLSCNVELISRPKLDKPELKFHLLPSSMSLFLLHTLSLCFSRRVRHSRPDISASGRQWHLRLLHKHLQLRPRSGESPHLYFIAWVPGRACTRRSSCTSVHLRPCFLGFFLPFEEVTHRALQTWEEKARTWTRGEKRKGWRAPGGIIGCWFFFNLLLS